MPRIEVNGRACAYRLSGEGPTVLLAHCSMGHSGMWKPILAELSRAFRVVAPDMPGHGDSEPPPEGMSLQLHAADMCEALIASLGAPAHLAGLSLGGAVVGRVAARSPRLVRSLTMIEPIWFHLIGEGHDEAGGAEERRMSEVHAALARGDAEAAAAAFMAAWGAPGAVERLDAATLAYAARCIVHVAADFPMASAWPEGQITRAEIAAIAPPVTLISGETTPQAAKDVLAEIAALLPEAEWRVVAGAGHLSPVTHPDEVLAILKPFIAGAERRAA